MTSKLKIPITLVLVFTLFLQLVSIIGALASISIGDSFTLYPSDPAGIADPTTGVIAGNGTITGAPKGLIGGTTVNGSNGSAYTDIYTADTLCATGANPCWGKNAVKFNGSCLNNSVTFTPASGLLTGIRSTVTYNGIATNGQWSAEISATVTYDGGKTETKICYPAGACNGYSSGQLLPPCVIGTYNNVESVKIFVSKGNSYVFIYSVTFTGGDSAPVPSPTPTPTVSPITSPSPVPSVVPSVVPSPTPSVTPTPSPTPTPSMGSYAVPLGIGAGFILYPHDKASITPRDGLYFSTWKGVATDSTGATFKTGPFTLTDTAQYMDKYYGRADIDVASGGMITSSANNACFNRYDLKVKGAIGTTITYTPTRGLLKGVETKVSLDGQGNLNNQIDVEVGYDNGKKVTIQNACDTNGLNSTKSAVGKYDLKINPFKDLEYVKVITKNTGEFFMPYVAFRVVNENPGSQAPNIYSPLYQKPNIPNASPEPFKINPIPTPNVDNSPLVINEALSNGNELSLKDKNGNPSDWIEIYNSSSSEINLTGYGLTDSPSSPFKWVFPTGTTIAAGQYMVVFASSLNKVIDGEIHTSFGISNSGETLMLSNPDGGILSVMAVPDLDLNTSFSRVPDGSNLYKITKPTPGGSNNDSQVIIKSYVSKPKFSAESGFYSAAFDLTLTSSNKVYYTTNGSRPAFDSSGNPLTGTNLYSTPLSIVRPPFTGSVLASIAYASGIYIPNGLDKSTVIRAVAVDEAGNVSDVATKTYFINYDLAAKYNNAMICSISTENDGLVGATNGIWTHTDDKLNTGMAWERSSHISLFKGDGTLAIDQDAGIRLHGFGSRTRQMKSLNVYARSDYGKSSFDYPLFDDAYDVNGKLIKSFDNFALRDGPRDEFGFTPNDGVMQKMSSVLGNQYQSQRPVVVFINGEYWGVYYMSDRTSDSYIEEHFGVPKDDVIIIKNRAPQGAATTQDATDCDTYRNWLATADFSIQSNVDKLYATTDVQNMLMYYGSNIAAQNRDWHGYNFVCWRSKTITDKPYQDGKWRFFMYDMDAAYYSEEDDNLLNQDLGGSWATAMYSNPTLRELFINTICDVYAYAYNTDKVAEQMAYKMGEFDPLINDMSSRWGRSLTDNPYRGNYNTILRSVYNSKPYFFNFIVTYFTTPGKYYKAHMAAIKKADDFNFDGNLSFATIAVNNSNMGGIKVNAIEPDFSKGSFTVQYFTSLKQTLVAEPKPGYKFVGWQASDGTYISSTTDAQTRIQIPITGSHVVANFAPIIGLNGAGTESDPYQISSADDLTWFVGQVNSGNVNYNNKNYILTTDIALTGENNFTAIGTQTNPFLGTFDGNFHTVSGINISSTVQGQGLFGFVGTGGTVRNIGVTNITIVSTGSNGKNVGGIVGNNTGTIENCYSTGSLSGISTVGGIAGNNSSGTIKNCYSIADVHSDSTATLGGIAGKTELSGSVSNCYSIITPPVAKIDTGTVDTLTSAKTSDEFANGTVTNLLNAGSTKTIWKNGTAAPVFADGSVVPAIGYSAGTISVSGIIGRTEAKAIVASYDDGKLIDIAILPVTIDQSGNGSVTLGNDFVAGTDSKIKIMLIDGINAISPLCNSITVTK